MIVIKAEDKVRKVAQSVYELTASKRLDASLTEYAAAKSEVVGIVSENGNDREKHRLRELLALEQTFINSERGAGFVTPP